MWIDGTSPLFAEALLNGLWQGLLIAGVVEALARLLRGRVAHLRYALWCAAFVMIVLLPALHLMSGGGGGIGAMAATASQGGVVASPVPAVSSFAPWSGWALPAKAADGITAVFLLLSLVGSLRVVALIASLARLRRLARTSTALPPRLEAALAETLRRHGRRNARIRVSNGISTPATIGFLRPIVLLPASLLPALDEEEWSRIVLHELAHVRRYDDWTNLVQRVLERFFFYLPAVVWAGRRLELEREMACDDFAARWCGSGRAYARCLMRVAEAARRDSLVLAPGAAGGAGQLSRRVASLLAPANAASGWMRTRLALGAAVVILVAGSLPSLPGVGFAVDFDGLASMVAAAPEQPRASPERIGTAADPAADAPAPTRSIPLDADRGTPRIADADDRGGPAPIPPVRPRDPEARVVELCSDCGRRPPQVTIVQAQRVELRTPPGGPAPASPSVGGTWEARRAPVQLTITVGTARSIPRSAAELASGLNRRVGGSILPNWLNVRDGSTWGATPVFR